MGLSGHAAASDAQPLPNTRCSAGLISTCAETSQWSVSSGPGVAGKGSALTLGRIAGCKSSPK